MRNQFNEKYISKSTVFPLLCIPIGIDRLSFLFVFFSFEYLFFIKAFIDKKNIDIFVLKSVRLETDMREREKASPLITITPIVWLNKGRFSSLVFVHLDRFHHNDQLNTLGHNHAMFHHHLLIVHSVLFMLH